MNSDSPWDYFVRPRKHSDGGVQQLWDGLLKKSRTASESEWAWLQAVDHLLKDDRWATTVLGDARVTVECTVAVEGRDFEVKMKRPDNFPEEEPIVECEHRMGFVIDWDGQELEKSLPDLVTAFTVYCQRLSVVLDLIEGCTSSFEIRVKDCHVDEEQIDCMAVDVELCASECQEVVTVLIDFADPHGFPRSLRSTVADRFLGMDTEKWDADQPLVFNLENFLCAPSSQF